MISILINSLKKIYFFALLSDLSHYVCFLYRIFTGSLSPVVAISDIESKQETPAVDFVCFRTVLIVLNSCLRLVHLPRPMYQTQTTTNIRGIIVFRNRQQGLLPTMLTFFLLIFSFGFEPKFTL